MKILKFARFPAKEFQYDELSDWPRFFKVNPTFIWIIGLILQIVTTLTSAYATFNTLVDELFIHKIKVISIVQFKANYKNFLGNRSISNNFLYACFWSEINSSTCLPDDVFIYDPLDDPYWQSLGESSVFFNSKLLNRESWYLSKWFSHFILFHSNNFRKRFWIIYFQAQRIIHLVNRYRTEKKFATGLCVPVVDISHRVSFDSASYFSTEIWAEEFALSIKRHTVLYRLMKKGLL